MKKIIIAIDGPAGSGKSTTSKELSKKLGYVHLDTGAMYRAIALAWLRTGLPENEEVLTKVMNDNEIDIITDDTGQKTLLNGVDVSNDIRTAEISKFASPISAWNVVREKLVDQQRRIGNNGGIVIDGRDIGTVVFPNAELKIFLIASIEKRAERRAKELAEKGTPIDLDELKSQIAIRDYNDSNRPISPLKKANDAIEVDTSLVSITEQVNIIYNLAIQKLNSK